MTGVETSAGPIATLSVRLDDGKFVDVEISRKQLDDLALSTGDDVSGVLRREGIGWLLVETGAGAVTYRLDTAKVESWGNVVTQQMFYRHRQALGEAPADGQRPSRLHLPRRPGRSGPVRQRRRLFTDPGGQLAGT